MVSQFADRPDEVLDHVLNHAVEVVVVECATGAVVRVIGEVDLSSVPALRASLDRVEAESFGHVAVEMSGVTFCDSSGLAALAAAHRRLTDSGRSFVVRNPATCVERVMTITRLDGLIEA